MIRSAFEEYKIHFLRLKENDTEGKPDVQEQKEEEVISARW